MGEQRKICVEFQVTKKKENKRKKVNKKQEKRKMKRRDDGSAKWLRGQRRNAESAKSLR